MQQDFDDFVTKAVALGRVFNMKGGRETVKILLERKGATRKELIAEVCGMNPTDASIIVSTLRDGGVLYAPGLRGEIMYINPNLKSAISTLAKPVDAPAVTMLKHGSMTAKFTKLHADDPIVEGTCNDYSFTAIMAGDPEKGIWGVGAEHFVMRDRATQVVVAKHDPEMGWMKRPASPKQITHLDLIERLFKVAPKKH